MVLKTWSEVQKIYNKTSKRLSKITNVSWPLHKAGLPWYIWAIEIGFWLASVPGFFGVWASKPGIAVIGWSLVFLAAYLRRFAANKVLAKVLSAEYATHGIAQYPSSVKGRISIMRFFFTSWSSKDLPVKMLRS